MKRFAWVYAFLVAGPAGAAQPTGEIVGCDRTHPKYAECQRQLEKQQAPTTAKKPKKPNPMAAYDKCVSVPGQTHAQCQHLMPAEQQAEAARQGEQHRRSAEITRQVNAQPLAQPPQPANWAFSKCMAEHGNRTPEVCRPHATSPDASRELDRRAEMERSRLEMNRRAAEERAKQK